MTNIEKVAREFCRLSGIDPDQLEPGNIYGVDGHLPNGDPAHFMWRQFVEKAKPMIKLCELIN